MKLSKYVEDNKIVLSQVEIRKLFKDKEHNRNKIIRTQLPLVLSIADSFSKTTGNPIEELFCNAMETLTKALNLYDETNKASFTTYVKVSITNQLSTKKSDGLIRTPVMNTHNKVFPTAYVFSDLNVDDDGEAKEFDVIDESEPYDSYEDEYIEAINEYTKNAKGADIVTRYLGLGYDKAMTFSEIGKLHNQTGANIRNLYHAEIQRLKDSDTFKKIINENK